MAVSSIWWATMRFQSTPPARGATPNLDVNIGRLGISIHAPREGGDAELLHRIQDVEISIHAPREGGDIVHAGQGLIQQVFQSTPPARGATSATGRWIAS